MVVVIGTYLLINSHRHGKKCRRLLSSVSSNITNSIFFKNSYPKYFFLLRQDDVTPWRASSESPSWQAKMSASNLAPARREGGRRAGSRRRRGCRQLSNSAANFRVPIHASGLRADRYHLPL